MIEPKIQKNRTQNSFNTDSIKYGDSAFTLKKETKIEFDQLMFFKKLLKKFLKKKKKKKHRKHRKKKHFVIKKQQKKRSSNYKIWFYTLPNYILSKKSKNSRMGKGKGLFIRWVYRLKKGHNIFEFSGLSPYFLKKLIILFNRKVNNSLIFIKKNKLFSQKFLWCKHNIAMDFFDKYRIM